MIPLCEQYFFSTDVLLWGFIEEPINAICAFQHAFKNDMGRIDAAAYEAAKGKEGLVTTIERFRFLNGMLVWHTTGEDLAVFPAVENVVPLVTKIL